MNFYFCLVVLLVSSIMGTLAKHTEKSNLEDLRSLKIQDVGESGSNKTSGPPRKHKDRSGKVKGILPQAFSKDKACQVPLELHDSDVKCTLHNDGLACNHTCQFGHAFNGGIMARKMECKYKKNKWTPVPVFEVCKPFVDCGFTMTSPGGSSCENSFFFGPSCEIFCDPYEDKDGVMPLRYWCDIEGRWQPELPYCAAPGSGIDLIPPPAGRKMVFNL